MTEAEAAKPRFRIIRRPNLLKAKVGTPPEMLDRATMKRAEVEVAALADSYKTHLARDVEGLLEMLQAVSPAYQEIAEEAFAVASRIAGEAPTQGFDKIGSAAASLCNILADASLIREQSGRLVIGYVQGMLLLCRKDALDGEEADALAATLAELASELAPTQDAAATE